MREASHTPGPWRVEGASTLNIIGYEKLKGRRVCSLLATSHEDNANARLIAAAPDCLELLQQFRKMFAFSPDGQIISRPKNLHDWLLSVDRTIAKATGGDK